MRTSARQPGALVISLDFELHWGVRDLWSIDDYRKNLLGVRAAVPGILDLFSELGIHATWAIVGFLFCESKRELLNALPDRKPSYTKRALSPYDALASVGENEEQDPFHFAPSLIRRIAATPHQEIGTHTFSHYYCLEAGQTPADFRDDLQAAVRIMRLKVARTPTSIVFPRNQISPPHVDVCRELGFNAYRGNPSHWAYHARPYDAESLVRRAFRLADAYLPLTSSNRHCESGADGAGPVNVPGTSYVRPYSVPLRRLEPLRMRRMLANLRTAATRGRLCHLWWHPEDFGVHVPENLTLLRQILTCFVRLRDAYGMESLTMAEAAERDLRASGGGGVQARESRAIATAS